MSQINTYSKEVIIIKLRGFVPLNRNKIEDSEDSGHPCEILVRSPVALPITNTHI